MSKISKMIEELCSNGVEYKPFNEYCEYIRGITYKKSDEIVDISNNEFIEVLRANNIDVEQNVLVFNDVKKIKNSVKVRDNQILKKGDILICAGSGSKEHIGKVAYINNDMNYTFGGFMGVIRCKKEINSRYLFHILTGFLFKKHLMKVSSSNSSTINNINNETWDNFEIPIPPLPIQEKIVEILDTFTKLEKELEKELEARKLQYEYYRDRLMTFDEKEVEWKRLDEIFTFIRNGFVGKVTSFFTDEHNGIRYLEGTNIHNGIISNNEVLYVTKEFHQRHIKNELKSDDILMVQSGHIGECAMVGEKYKGSNCHALIIMSNGGNVLSKFYVHYFHSFKGFRSLTPAITGGTIKHVLAGKVGNIKVPVPSLEKQKEIVDILDKFERCCLDEQDGLPAEIEARKQQYEYYRDKLLTFKRKEE